eukprot:scaffold227725_cov49-Attheya_sp.AAC.1
MQRQTEYLALGNIVPKILEVSPSRGSKKMMLQVGWAWGFLNLNYKLGWNKCTDPSSLSMQDLQ